MIEMHSSFGRIRCKCLVCSLLPTQRVTYLVEFARSLRVHLPDHAFMVVLLGFAEHLDESGEAASFIKVLGLSDIRRMKASALLNKRRRAEQIRYRALLESAVSLSNDMETTLLLQSLTTKSYSFSDNTSKTLNLRLNGEDCIIQVPGFGGAWAVLENLLLQPYTISALPKVDHILDLGAYIGLASVSLATQHPEAKMICVEPSAVSREYLTKNIRVLRRNSIIYPFHVGAGGKAAFHETKEVPSMLNSLLTTHSERQRTHLIDTVPLYQIWPSGSYGIKIDIEGAEYLLQNASTMLESAAWIVGEVHYGTFSKTSHQWFQTLLSRAFKIRMGPPKLDWRSDGPIVARQFIAIRNLD